MVIWFQGNPLRKGTGDGLQDHEGPYPHAIRSQHPAGSSALPTCYMGLIVTCSLQCHSMHLIWASPIGTEKSWLALRPYRECKKIHVSCKEDKINPTSVYCCHKAQNAVYGLPPEYVRSRGASATAFLRASVCPSCALTFLGLHPLFHLFLSCFIVWYICSHTLEILWVWF